MIPMIDLKTQYHNLKAEIDNNLANVLEKTQFMLVPNAIYYPIPQHKQNVFIKDYADISLPVSEKVTSECLSLPLFPELQESQIATITSTIKSIF